MVTRADVDAAATRIAGHVRRTPVLVADPPDGDARLWCTLEQLQHTGTFKARAR